MKHFLFICFLFLSVAISAQVPGHYTYQHGWDYPVKEGHLTVHETGTMDFDANGTACDSACQTYRLDRPDGSSVTWVFNYVSPSHWRVEQEHFYFAGEKSTFRMELCSFEGTTDSVWARSYAEGLITPVRQHIDRETRFHLDRSDAEQLVWSLTYPNGHTDHWYFFRYREHDLPITNFGARGDGVTLNTTCIQAAIDSAHHIFMLRNQKARVVVPQGTFVSGTLYLKSGVTLHLEKGATLLGSTNPFDYIKDPTVRWTSFIFAIRQHDIAITGNGTIDGRGWEVANNMVNYIHLGLVDDPLKYDRPNEGNRPENIHFRECEQVVVSGITLRNPASWNQQYDQCRYVLIENQTVDSKNYWNNDGVDIVDCQHVVIRNCHMDAADDVFCFKSHSVDGLSEDILVENCTGRSSANGIKFGTMTRGLFRHFRFRNITLYDTYRSAITVASVDGGALQDIVIDGLKATNTGNPIFLRFAERRQGSVTPCLKDIVIKNVYVEVPAHKPDAGYSYEGPVEDQPRNTSPSSIVGTPDHRIQNITLENIEIHYPGGSDSSYAFCGSDPQSLALIAERTTQYPEFSMFKELPAWGLYLRHADNIHLKNVHMLVANHDYRPCIVADDVKGLTLVDSRPATPQLLIANGCSSIKAPGYHVVKQKAVTLTIVDSHQGELSNPDTLGKHYKASLFGIKNNGTTLNTNSIQRAVDYIAQQGGGCLEFYVGRYLTGTVRVPRGVHILLHEGAILVPSSNPYDHSAGIPSSPLLFEDSTEHPFGLGFIEELK